MSDSDLWPFIFEVNPIQRKARRERTVFVEIEEDGTTRWQDFTGRLTRRGGIGGIAFEPGGEIRHSRGDRELSPEQEKAERDEFSIKVDLATEEIQPIRSLIESVGKPFLGGWTPSEAQTLHALLEELYWKHVNRFMHDPFDPNDA